MLSIATIDKALERRDYDRLLRDLGRNGLAMPLPLRVQLAESPAGARGLGLRRLVELTYAPTMLTTHLIRKLIAAQGPTGALHDAAGRPSCLLTAACAAGLGRVLRDHAGRLGELRDALETAYGHALAALAGMQQPDGLFAGPQDRSDRERLLTSAFIAYLLIDSPRFAAVCHGHALLSALEDRLDHCDPGTAQLIDMARLTRLVPADQPTAAMPGTSEKQPEHTPHQPSLLNAA